jgi:hypothetical protein
MSESRVTAINPFTSVNVSIDGEGQWTEYVRHSADNWQCWMGESLESMYDCAGLEILYQQFLAQQDDAA